MFRVRSYLNNGGLRAFDLIVIGMCYFTIGRLELHGTPWPVTGWISQTPGRFPALGFIFVLWLLLSAYFHLYHSRRMDSPFADALTLFKIGLASWIFLDGTARFFPRFILTPPFSLRFEAVSTCTLVATRLALRLFAHALRRQGRNVKNLVLIATPEIGNRVAEKIQKRAYLGYRIVHRIHYRDSDLREATRLIAEFQEILSSIAVEDVIIALPAEAHGLTAQFARESENRGVNVRIVPDLFPLIHSDTQVYDLDGIPLVNVRLYPTENLRYAVIKRVFDVTVSFVVLALFFPVYLLIVLLVKLSSSGPVFFSQERVGLNGRKFKILKFRTMRTDLNPDTHWTVPNDPHVTKLGRWLRGSGLDEIPQFLNVLKGDMSIVGPRPERPIFLERFRRQVPEYMARHYVKCGITGWAQINGWRGDTSITQRIACDLYYIRNWALGLDFKIVFLTVIRTFFHRNVC